MATDSLEIRMARLEGSSAQVDRRLATIETDLRDLRAEIRELRRDMHQQFRWVIGLVVITILVPIALRFLP